MQHLYPQPSPKHIANTQALYWKKYRKRLTEEEAREVLIRVIRFLYFGAGPRPEKPEDGAVQATTNPAPNPTPDISATV